MKFDIETFLKILDAYSKLDYKKIINFKELAIDQDYFNSQESIDRIFEIFKRKPNLEEVQIQTLKYIED